MNERRWEVRIGSPVVATDGDYGYLQELILDPEQERIAALVVRRHGLLPIHIVAVSEEAIANATENEVRLKMRREQLDALPEYQPNSVLAVEGRKYKTDDTIFAIRGAHGVEVGHVPRTHQPGMGTRALVNGEQVALRVRTGQQVICTNGHAGKVKMILTDPSGRVKGFTMNANSLLNRDLIVPATWVQEVDQENVRISVDTQALETVPEYGPDEALASEIDTALWQDETLRETDYKAIGIAVQDGNVRLRGHVTTSANKKRAEAALRSVRGVLGIQNQLVVDEDLLVQVAQVIGKDELTRSEQVLVGAQNGVIILNGNVSGMDVRAAAEAAAASIPQVRGIVNYLRVPGMVIDAEDQQVWEPPVGQEVFSTDMLLGRVEKVIINPRNRRVTAFTVYGNFADPSFRGDRPWPNEISQQKRRVIIPIHAVQYETFNSVLLKTSSGEAARSPAFDPADFVSPPVDWQPPYPYRWEDVLITRQTTNGSPN
jgi:osmotically-inducible protein OsmY/sporulation protein YlmC with PRC-barrel domain